jgi:hypothetical protein
LEDSKGDEEMTDRIMRKNPFTGKNVDVTDEHTGQKDRGFVFELMDERKVILFVEGLNHQLGSGGGTNIMIPQEQNGSISMVHQGATFKWSGESGGMAQSVVGAFFGTKRIPKKLHFTDGTFEIKQIIGIYYSGGWSADKYYDNPSDDIDACLTGKVSEHLVDKIEGHFYQTRAITMAEKTAKVTELTVVIE